MGIKQTELSFVESITDDKRQALDVETDSSYNIREGRKQLKSERKYKNMKKNIGKSLALYPTPLVVVGTMVNEKPNYVLAGHVGIMGHDRIMVSLAKSHYTNQGIKETRALTVNIVDEAMLKKADRTGCVSGNKVDKSDMFAFHIEGTGAPVIDEAPVVMDCTVDDIYETEGFDNFICKIDGVYAEENVLNDAGKIDYHTLKPVLFEMPTYEYLRTGDVIGKCMNL